MPSHHAESWVWCSKLTFESQLFGQICLTHCMKRKEKQHKTEMTYFTLYVYLRVLPEVFSVSSAGK